MPDAEKIIAKTFREYMPGADGEADSRTFATAIAAALRGAGMLVQGDAKLLQNYEAGWEYGAGYQADNGIEMRWFSMDSGAFTIREAAEREVERFSDAQIRLVRRRKPGPWEPVPEEAADA